LGSSLLGASLWTGSGISSSIVKSGFVEEVVEVDEVEEVDEVVGCDGFYPAAPPKPPMPPIPPAPPIMPPKSEISMLKASPRRGSCYIRTENIYGFYLSI
jgi:hypothetical protein